MKKKMYKTAKKFFVPLVFLWRWLTAPEGVKSISIK